MEHRNTLMLEVFKLLISLCLGIIGFAIAMVAAKLTTDSNILWPIIVLGISILTSMFGTVWLVDNAEGNDPYFEWLEIVNEKWMFYISWFSFLIGTFLTFDALL